MGIYPDHGLEYHVVLKNNMHLIVANIKDIDNRLEKSEFYKKRKDKWFMINNNICKLLSIIDLHDLDIELNENEKNKLNEYLNKYGEEVDDHGWYDVCKIYDTYEL